MTDMVEFVGLTHEAAALIEHFRVSQSDTKMDIIVRELSELKPTKVPQHVPTAIHASEPCLDLGQGVRLRVGELLELYLSEDAKRLRHPDGRAEVHRDGIYMNGKRVGPSKGSYLQPAMRMVQEKRNHRNEKGEIISLSAWRQWHVERGGKLVSLASLKDPALARRRARSEVGA